MAIRSLEQLAVILLVREALYQVNLLSLHAPKISLMCYSYILHFQAVKLPYHNDQTRLVLQQLWPCLVVSSIENTA